MRRPWIAVAALSVACGGVPREPREPTPGVAHFTVLTYNAKVQRFSDAATIQAVGSGDADVIALQEISAGWKLSLEASYRSRYPYKLFETRESPSGMAILSRYPLDDDGRGMIIPPGGEHPAWVVKVALPTFTLQIVAVHLRALFNGEHESPIENYFDAGDVHREQIELFFESVDPALPTVVLGDFNEGVGGEAVRWLEARGFQNALHAFRPGQFTWSGQAVGQTYDLAIDHVMAGPDFELLDARTFRAGRSDHLPVWAHLEYGGASSW